jgi:vitamin B12 transport system ATP-binding protein
MRTSRTASITLRDISIRKGGKNLLRPFSAEIFPSEIVMVLGKNGSGKTSLLRVIAGLDRPQSGSVQWDHIPFKDWDLQNLSRRRSMVCQHSEAFPSLTVQEMMELTLERVGVPSVEFQRKISPLLHFLPIQDLWEKSFCNLSGGERQLCRIMRAILQISWNELESGIQSKTLLLDEPFAALDLDHQYQVAQLIRKLKSWRVSILMVVHELHWIQYFSDRVWIINRGHVHTPTLSELENPDLLFQWMGFQNELDSRLFSIFPSFDGSEKSP